MVRHLVTETIKCGAYSNGLYDQFQSNVILFLASLAMPDNLQVDFSHNKIVHRQS